MKFLIFILLASFAPRLSAQPDLYNKIFRHEKDSLVKELGRHPAADTSRAMALINILESSAFLSQKKEVLRYWQEAFNLSKTLAFQKGEAMSLEWIGSFYKSSRRNDSALYYLDAAVRVAGRSTELWLRRTKGFAEFQRAMIYEGQENYYTALNSYFESLKNYDSADLYKQKTVNIRIAWIYRQLHNDEKALQYYQTALRLYLQSNPANNGGDAEGIYAVIAEIYLDRNELSEATLYLHKIRPYMPDTVETMVTGGYYHLAGEIALKEKRGDSAIYFLQNAIKYYNYTREMHIDDIANVSIDIVRLELDKRDMREARKYAETALTSAKEGGHKQTIANALVVMAAYYHGTGDQTSAYNALHEASVLHDSVLAETNIRQANTLGALYENDKKEKAITRLELEKKVEAAAAKQEALLNTIFIITIVALLLISAMLYLYFKNQREIEQQRITELEKEKQLMGVEAMLKGQEDERSRLARDLHDGLGGMLSGVKISFSTMKENIIMDAENAIAFERSLAQLDKTIAELRKVAHNLMPEALVRFGLKSALADFCESIQLSANTRIICEQFGVERDLGNIGDVNVYRIVQELVNNAVLHGKAQQILVQLTKTTDKILITVEDNGQGFDMKSSERVKGIGLSNIQSRVNYFNGVFQIESKPSEGTVVNIELIV